MEMDNVRPQLDGVKFKESSQEDNTYLLEKFSLEEVKMVVWECGNFELPMLTLRPVQLV